MERDLKEARELQVLLTPNKAAGADGLRIAAGFRPAHEVSGDIYDLFPCRDGHTVLTFGDVSGKGAAAALYGAVLSGLLRSLITTQPRPGQLLKSLNQALIQRRVNSRFVSLLALSWQPRGRRLALANAGSLPPIICRRGEILERDLGGVPLGLWEVFQYEEATLEMQPQDVVVLYSDGISERQNAAGEPYERRRMIRLLQKAWEQSPQAIVDRIFRDVDRFAGPTASDDQTLVVLQVN